MKVSIVTISFNQGEFLERALRSVLAQDYPGLEYIVVDPGSTDASRAVIERYRDRIARIIYEPDDGPADGLNKGFAVATGEVFGFLNADDMLLPGAVRQAVGVFRQRPDADVVYGHGFLIDEHDRVIRRFHSDRFSLWRFVHDGVSILQQATFFRRAAFEAAGGFNPANCTCWDGELWLEMALNRNRFRLVHHYWAAFRLHKQSISGSGRSQAAYLADRQRLLRRATARPPNRWDPILRVVARLIKWYRNPRGLVERVADITGLRRLRRDADRLPLASSRRLY